MALDIFFVRQIFIYLISFVRSIFNL